MTNNAASGPGGAPPAEHPVPDTSDAPGAAMLWHRWCPPPQDDGRFDARFEILDSTYSQVRARRRARFGSAWLARAWLQHHGARAGNAPCRAVADLATTTQQLRGVYDASGPADEVVAALTVAGEARGDLSPASHIADTDTAVLALLLTEYRWCVQRLHHGGGEEYSRYRANLRGLITTLLSVGALTPTDRRRATIELRGADLTLLERPDGDIRAALDQLPGHTETAAPPAVRGLVHARVASVRHAREILMHQVHARAEHNTTEQLRARIVDARTGESLHLVTGTAAHIEDTLAAVTEFDGTLLLGLPDLDLLHLLSLVLDYETRAADLSSLDAEHRAADPGSPWRTGLHAQQHRRREITAMLADPALRHHTPHVYARLIAADALIERPRPQAPATARGAVG
ncbi:hypothetical protein [Nocardia sp. NPDC003963]